MSYPTASAAEIDRKLRDDFRRRIKEFGVETDIFDPVLAAIFRSFAQQIETLYSDTARIRLALLDELIAGLGIEGRVSRPSQTVLRLLPALESQRVGAGLDLIGEAQSGERLIFRTDSPIQVSAARVAALFLYRNGTLHLSQNFDLPDTFQNVRPSHDPVRVNLGGNPAIYLAVEDLPPTHLSFHSFFFEFGANSFAVQDALQYEPWCLIGNSGELSSRGILRHRSQNAGIRGLEWLLPPTSNLEPSVAALDDSVTLPAGFYGPRLFVMPDVPPDRRFVCSVPREMDDAIARIFGRDSKTLFSRPRAWVKIALPATVENLDTSIGSVSLHAITASNVECVNQTIYFDRQGTSIPISREAGTSSYLVAPISVRGETGAAYIPESEASPDIGTGRYAIRNGRIELRPALLPSGAAETFANVRIWVTAGPAGNRVGPGGVKAFAQKKDGVNLNLSNPTAAAGGSALESQEDAQARFARAILSRDRILTRADLVAAARAHDRRIRDIQSRTALERTGSGLRRVQKLTLLLDAKDFADPPAEARILEQDLASSFERRMPYDTHLSLTTRWV